MRRHITPPSGSVAILPFKDLSAEWDQQYLCAGISEDLATALARGAGLRVASTTSARRWQAHGLDIAEIGQRLQVEHLVDGAVRRQGQRLWISVELTRAADGRRLWADRYEREMADLFAIEEAIVRGVVARVQPERGPLGDLPLVRRGTMSAQAHDLGLRGRFYASRRGRWSLRTALEAFQDATVVDPEYALAHAGLASCYTSICTQGIRPGLEMSGLATLAARSAQMLDPHLPEAFYAAGVAHAFVHLDFASGEQALQACVRLDPRAARAHACLALLYAALARAGDARESIDLALGLEPDSALIHYLVGEAAYWLGDLERSEPCVARAIDLDPEMTSAHRLRALLLWQRGQQVAARDAALHAAIIGARQPVLVGTLGLICGATGQLAHAEAALAELQARGAYEYVSPLYLADILIGLGRDDEAITQMERALTEQSGLTLGLVAPEYGLLRERARFVAVLRRMHLSTRS